MFDNNNNYKCAYSARSKVVQRTSRKHHFTETNSGSTNTLRVAFFLKIVTITL